MGERFFPSILFECLNPFGQNVSDVGKLFGSYLQVKLFLHSAAIFYHRSCVYQRESRSGGVSAVSAEVSYHFELGAEVAERP